MTVESVIADEIIARLTPDINAIIGRLDALTAVQLDINTQVRDLRTAIEQAVAECPCDDVAPPPASLCQSQNRPPQALERVQRRLAPVLCRLLPTRPVLCVGADSYGQSPRLGRFFVTAQSFTRPR